MRIDSTVTMVRFKYWTLCYVLIFAQFGFEQASAKSTRLIPKEPKYDFNLQTIKLCPNADSLVSEVNYELVNGTGRVNGTLSKPLKSITKIVAGITRCKTHCEHFQTWRFPAGCPVLEQKNTFWYPFLQSFEPKIKCPLKPGIFMSNNAKLDTRQLLALPFPRENSRFKVRIEALDGDVTAACLDCVFSMTELSSKGSRP